MSKRSTSVSVADPVQADTFELKTGFMGVVQKIQFGLSNRWFRLVLWFVTMLLCSCPYYGWQFMRQMMEEEGLLRSLCPDGLITCSDENIAAGTCPDDYSSTGAYCKAEEVAYASGNTVASGMEYGMGLFAGILFDNFGPLPCAALGCVVHVLSWILVLSGNRGAFIGGMALMGGAVNFICFPSFILVDLFPSRPMLMSGVVLCAQVGAALVMPIIYEFNTPFTTIMWIFTLCVTLPLFVLYCLSMPFSRKSLNKEYLRKGLKQLEFASPNWKTFAKCWLTPEIWLFLVWYVLLVSQTSYYNAQLSELTSAEIALIIGYIWMAQGPMSLLFAWINDTLLKTIPVCFCISGLMTLAWSLTSNTGVPGSPQWVADLAYMVGGIAFIFQNSHIYTTKYNYALEMYPKEHFGKLAGAIGVFAGVLQQVNILMDTHVDIYVSYVIYGCMVIPQVALLFFLYRQQYVKNVCYINAYDEVLPIEGEGSPSSSMEGANLDKSQNSSSDISSSESAE